MKKMALLIIACLSVFWIAQPAFSWPVPDTGQSGCFDSATEIPCPGGQAFNGQDGNYSINLPSYTKLDENGSELPADAASWAMVRDNVTGLIWEVKQNKDGRTDYADPHDADNHYTWYDSSSDTNGGYPGAGGDLADTEDFISSLNNERFGGFEDWRLPTVLEIASIIDYGSYGPAVDQAFFPQMIPAGYWSSVTHASNPGYAWRIDLGSGIDDYFPKANSYYAVAVRGGKTANAFAPNGDGTVSDSSTGLVWAQYPATDASGNPKAMTWQEALSHCEDSMLGGFPDWRLPTVKELLSIADYSKTGPVIDEAAFPSTPGSLFWTGTTSASDPAGAWHVDFGSGGASYWVQKTSALYVRAVRGGKAPQPDTGSLQVFVLPDQARNSGAKWRRVGSTEWRDSGYIEADLPVGTYLVEFKDAVGWVPPQALNVNVVKDQAAQATGTYTPLQYAVLYVNKDDYPGCSGHSPCFSSIGGAVSYQGNAKHIKVVQGNYPDIIEADKNESLLLEGGYNSAFSAVVSITSVGPITVSDGNLILANIQIGAATAASQSSAVDPLPSLDAGRSVPVSDQAGGDAFLKKAMASARVGSPERGLLEALGSDIGAILEGCSKRESTSGFPMEIVSELYNQSLGCPPEPWVVQMWLCYADYLAGSLGMDESQSLWAIAANVFESAEYAQRKQDSVQTLDDLFEVLLSRPPSTIERETWLNGDWTQRQAIFGLTMADEFKTIAAERWGVKTEPRAQSELINLYIGLLDRLPTAGEVYYHGGMGEQSFNFSEVYGRVLSAILASEEFKLIEPTARGRFLRLGLTFMGPEFDELYPMLPGLEELDEFNCLVEEIADRTIDVREVRAKFGVSR